MRTSIVAVIVLVGGLLLAMPGSAQAGSTSYWHHRHEHYRHNVFVGGDYPVMDFWYGYYYYPGTRCFYHGWWRTCTVGDVTP